MAHGMGMPSIGIYSHELYAFYNVNTIIRVGSAGSFVKEAGLGSIIVVRDAYSDSNYANEIGIKPKNKILSATPSTLALCEKVAKKEHIKILTGNILCEDAFYSITP
jgi:purine-nucleoside phosphorylase